MYLNMFVIMNVHTYVYGNSVCSIRLCILVCYYMHACHLLDDVYVLFGGRDRVEPEVIEEEYCYYLLYWGKDRVEPELIEGEYCYYFIEVCMNVCL